MSVNQSLQLKAVKFQLSNLIQVSTKSAFESQSLDSDQNILWEGDGYLTLDLP